MEKTIIPQPPPFRRKWSPESTSFGLFPRVMPRQPLFWSPESSRGSWKGWNRIPLACSLSPLWSALWLLCQVSMQLASKPFFSTVSSMQCCGSGSTCFWASGIRIHKSDVCIRILLSPSKNSSVVEPEPEP
jgi:hypothetical protein